MNRALLVGINAYPGNELNGCVNDVKDMADFLVEKCNFQFGEIRLLVDERATTQEIKSRLGWLLNGLRTGDRVLFHYSGHGAQVPTRNPQGEVDGLDEVICPVDFDWSDDHMIRDKDFHSIFSSIPDGVEFIWISDSCHSQDLTKGLLFNVGTENCRPKTIFPPADIDWRLQTAKMKGTKSLTMLKAAESLHLALISGCKSDQTSADAFIDGKYNGALTRFLLNDLSKTGGLSKDLISIVQELNNELRKDRYLQSPQIEGDEKIMNSPFLDLHGRILHRVKETSSEVMS